MIRRKTSSINWNLLTKDYLLHNISVYPKNITDIILNFEIQHIVKSIFLN